MFHNWLRVQFLWQDGARQGTDKPHPGHGLYCPQLNLGLLRMPHIVGIQQSNPLASRQANAGIARTRKPPVGLVHVVNPIGKWLQAIPRVIGAPVINNDDLHRTVGLRQRALDSVDNEVAVVETEV